MIEKGKELWRKYEEIIVYLIVGGLTTVVAFAAKFGANAILYDNTMNPTPIQNAVLSAINWGAGVLFAYPTNRKFVFKSKDPIRTEFPKFVFSRVSTFVLDEVIMQIFGHFRVHLVVATVISSVLVVIGNYVFSKLFVFKDKKKSDSPSE
ncbi:MAG: GtrA family protein [Bacteroidales bacterium]|nr:GtrA family protein [Lachnoclostridium sp.]MCM1384175.1 GtrA family protein [Lachnoclostridium sp.]MCM1464841.1 GtrA family protein [Bacteroidales bacterium]